MNDHERGFLEFLAEPARGRMRTLLELGGKRRADVRSMLDHVVGLDPRRASALKGKASLPDAIFDLLRQHGAPLTCFLLTGNAELDGREMPLDEALRALIGMGDGVYISCIAGRLGLYEYAEADSCYLLVR